MKKFLAFLIAILMTTQAHAYTQIQLRRDTAANWTSADTVLASGEPGYETDTGNLKLGDGTTAWTSLEYFSPLSSDAISMDRGGTSATKAQDAIDNLTDEPSASAGQVWTSDGSNGGWADAAGGYWTEVGATNYLSTVNNSAVIGSTTSIDNAKLSVLGTQDDVQFAVKANSTQTKNIVEILSGDNTVVFSVSRDSGAVIGGSISNIGLTATSTYLSSDTTNKITLGKTGGENIRVDVGTTENTLSLDSTTGANILSTGSIGLRVASMDAGAIYPIPVTLTDGANITWDASQGNYYVVTLKGQPRNLNNPSGGKQGQKIVIMVSQDSTGSRKMGFGTNFAFGSTVTSFDATTTAGIHDYIGLIKGPGVSWDVVAVDKGHK